MPNPYNYQSDDDSTNSGPPARSIKKYEIVFIEYGVEFISRPQTESVAEDCIRKLENKGITTCYKRDANP